MLVGLPVYYFWSRIIRTHYETQAFRLHALVEDAEPRGFNLATSGVAPFPLRELPIHLETLEINGDSSYGHAPLQKAIATHHGIDPDCVVESAGTSMANHLAMAAIIEPRDEVLIEHPAYGPILDIAHYLEANVKRFRRVDENGWVIDPEEVRRCVTPRRDSS